MAEEKKERREIVPGEEDFLALGDSPSFISVISDGIHDEFDVPISLVQYREDVFAVTKIQIKRDDIETKRLTIANLRVLGQLASVLVDVFEGRPVLLSQFGDKAVSDGSFRDILAKAASLGIPLLEFVSHCLLHEANESPAMSHWNTKHPAVEAFRGLGSNKIRVITLAMEAHFNMLQPDEEPGRPKHIRHIVLDALGNVIGHFGRALATVTWFWLGQGDNLQLLLPCSSAPASNMITGRLTPRNAVKGGKLSKARFVDIHYEGERRETYEAYEQLKENLALFESQLIETGALASLEPVYRAVFQRSFRATKFDRSVSKILAEFNANIRSNAQDRVDVASMRQNFSSLLRLCLHTLGVPIREPRGLSIKAVEYGYAKMLANCIKIRRRDYQEDVREAGIPLTEVERKGDGGGGAIGARIPVHSIAELETRLFDGTYGPTNTTNDANIARYVKATAWQTKTDYPDLFTENALSLFTEYRLAGTNPELVPALGKMWLGAFSTIEELPRDIDTRSPLDPDNYTISFAQCFHPLEPWQLACVDEFNNARVVWGNVFHILHAAVPPGGNISKWVYRYLLPVHINPLPATRLDQEVGKSEQRICLRMLGELMSMRMGLGMPANDPLIVETKIAQQELTDVLDRHGPGGDMGPIAMDLFHWPGYTQVAWMRILSYCQAFNIGAFPAIRSGFGKIASALLNWPRPSDIPIVTGFYHVSVGAAAYLWILYDRYSDHVPEDGVAIDRIVHCLCELQTLAHERATTRHADFSFQVQPCDQTTYVDALLVRGVLFWTRTSTVARLMVNHQASPLLQGVLEEELGGDIPRIFYQQIGPAVLHFYQSFIRKLDNDGHVQPLPQVVPELVNELRNAILVESHEWRHRVGELFAQRAEFAGTVFGLLEPPEVAVDQQLLNLWYDRRRQAEEAYRSYLQNTAQGRDVTSLRLDLADAQAKIVARESLVKDSQEVMRAVRASILSAAELSGVKRDEYMRDQPVHFVRLLHEQTERMERTIQELTNQLREYSGGPGSQKEYLKRQQLLTLLSPSGDTIIKGKRIGRLVSIRSDEEKGARKGGDLLELVFDPALQDDRSASLFDRLVRAMLAISSKCNVDIDKFCHTAYWMYATEFTMQQMALLLEDEPYSMVRQKIITDMVPTMSVGTIRGFQKQAEMTLEQYCVNPQVLSKELIRFVVPLAHEAVSHSWSYVRSAVDPDKLRDMRFDCCVSILIDDGDWGVNFRELVACQYRHVFLMKPMRADLSGLYRRNEMRIDAVQQWFKSWGKPRYR